LLRDVGSVRGGVHQRLGLAGVADTDTDQPALAVRVLVDDLRLVDRLLIHLEHLARERGDDVGHRLHGLDLSARRALRHRRPDLWRLEVDELAERVLREPGDPERRLLALDPRPVVLGVVAEIVGVALRGGH
jgi:hypothetical protein